MLLKGGEGGKFHSLTCADPCHVMSETGQFYECNCIACTEQR